MTKLRKLSCDKKKDPVERIIRNMTAKEFVDWLVEYKGLPNGSAENVRMNLDEQFKYHNLQGRLNAGALTAKGMADALDAFWNAAIGDVRNSQASSEVAVVGAVAQGFAAVSAHLRKGGAA